MDIDSSSRADARPPDTSAPWLALGAWLVVLMACTLVLWLFRDEAHEAHMALAYLLIVLGGSASHGRLVGLGLAVASFLCFNFFLLEPYYTLTVEDPLDWWVLVSFLVTGAVAAQLFHRTQRALAVAEDRTAEVRRLSALGAESLSVPRAVDAVGAIVRVVHAELPVDVARVWIFDGDRREPRLLAAAPEGSATDLIPRDARSEIMKGRPVVLGPEGVMGPSVPGSDVPAVLSADPMARSALIPLRVRERSLGVLDLTSDQGLHLDRDQAVFADTLSYYAALAVERVRLSEEVEHVEALREADRVKDALLASVSHDLRTPLTTIRALANELRATGDERLVVIEEEAEHLNRLVTDLLDFSRIRSGSLPMETGLNAAEDLVGSMLQRLRGVRGHDRVDVTLPPGDLLIGRFDFVHALRALGNLVENALHHSSDDDGRVEVRVSREGDALCFAVLDRGPGVPPAERDRIFEPFQRASTTDHAGTGLGLAIAREVAEAQGGSITYHPRSGGGSVFELRLPAEDLYEIP